MTMKKSLIVLKTTYLRWLLSPRLLIFCFSYMFFYVYFIKPQLDLTDYFSTPINIFEPFVSLINNGYFLPLLALAYIILISDQPQLDDSATLVLFRTGRIPWILGQIWFLISSALTFVSFMLVTSIISVANKGFVLNGWSLVAKNSITSENSDLIKSYPFAIIDSSVITQSRPYFAVITGIVLLLMFMVSVGLIMLTFSLIRKKIIGVFMNIGVIVIGLVLWAIDIKLKWLFPIANSAFGWHYDKLYNKTIMPIEYSIIYFIVVCCILTAIAFVVGKKCSFHIVGGNE